MRGIPLRVELGPKDIAANKCVVVRRDTREKIEVSLDEIETKIPELLETVQKDMFARAKAHRDAHIWDAHNYEEFKDIAENKPGFIRGMWCGDQACEDKIKEDLAVTSRCMPFNDQEQISDVVYAVENRHISWYIGARHIKNQTGLWISKRGLEP